VALLSTGTSPPRDAEAIAKLLISRYGEQATAYASHQALKARSRGDQRLMNAWNWIAGAVTEVLRTEPHEAARNDAE
jgi:hypothetical protein